LIRTRRPPDDRRLRRRRPPCDKPRRACSLLEKSPWLCSLRAPRRRRVASASDVITLAGSTPSAAAECDVSGLDEDPRNLLASPSSVRLVSAEAVARESSTGSSAPFGGSNRSMAMLVLPGLAGAGHGATKRPEHLPPDFRWRYATFVPVGSGPGKRSAVLIEDLLASARAGARPAPCKRVPASSPRG
jgi:hypothetical protein